MVLRARPSAVRLLWGLGLAAAATAGACSHDWDAYDPRLGGGAAGGGGAGGATSTSTTMGCEPGVEEPCYTGPAGTEGVGTCIGGLWTCAADGSGFGACAGEVTPAAEICPNGADDDCDGTADDAGDCGCAPGATQSCYGGPEGTAGVGFCQAGQQSCAAGNVWGPCLGQVGPAPEDCATRVDDDCNGAENEQCPLWSRRYGGLLDQYARAVAIDGAGNVVVAGDLKGSTAFGGTTLTSAGLRDVVVARLDQDGTLLWSRLFGDAADQVAFGVAADPSGNLFVAGAFQGTLDFGLATPLVSAGLFDAFVVKLDPAGTPLWGVSFGDALDQQAFAVAADPSGNVIVTGEFQGTVDFGGGPATAVAYNGFVVKLDALGAYAWSLPFGTSGDDWGQGVAADANGNVLLTGSFDDSASFGGPPLVETDNNEAFVAKLDPAGGHVWSRSVVGVLDQIGEAIGVDAAGNVAVSGTFDGNIDVGAGPVASAGADDVFVMAFDPAGNIRWGKTYGDAVVQNSHALAVAPGGNVYVGVNMAGNVDYGGGPLLCAGAEDFAVVALDALGNHVYSRRFGDSADQDPRGLAVGPDGHPVLAGECSGTVNFGNGSLFSSGDDDICIAKLPP